MADKLWDFIPLLYLHRCMVHLILVDDMSYGEDLKPTSAACMARTEKTFNWPIQMFIMYRDFLSAFV